MHTHCTATAVCTLPNRGQACESYWDKSGEDVYEVSYRVSATNSNERKRLPLLRRILQFSAISAEVVRELSGEKTTAENAKEAQRTRTEFGLGWVTLFVMPAYFTPELFHFLTRLKRNNEREWFQ